ncbi:MAG: PcfJ domain-containing protein [Pseudomonadales bacterium]|nr:PcfJ domain-containing protein [Pseudomonadales bacterium]
MTADQQTSDQLPSDQVTGTLSPKITPSLTPFNPGERFKDNKLYLFSDRGVKVMSVWPRLSAWSKSIDKPYWQCVRPATRFFFPEGFTLHKNPPCYICALMARPGPVPEHTCTPFATDEWRAFVPKTVQDIVSPFKRRQWHLLAMMGRCGPAAIELTDSNPGLAWALASSWVFKSRPVQNPNRSIRRLLSPGHSRKDIAQWLEFDGQASTLRLLKKLSPDDIDGTLALNLRKAMQHDKYRKLLSHLPRINKSVMHLINMPEETSGILTQNLLFAAVEVRDFRFLLNDICRMCRELEIRLDQPVQDLEGLINLHDELVDAVNRKTVEDQPLPVPGNLLDSLPPQLQWINSTGALFDEGRTMHHCAGGFHKAALNGELYFFQVHGEQRATLAIKPKGDQYTIVDFKSYCNAPVEGATRKLVSQWLEAIQENRQSA